MGFNSASKTHIWAKDGEVPIKHSLPKNTSHSGDVLLARITHHFFSMELMISLIIHSIKALCRLVVKIAPSITLEYSSNIRGQTAYLYAGINKGMPGVYESLSHVWHEIFYEDFYCRVILYR